jgi:low affinity Fe/Cu permease
MKERFNQFSHRASKLLGSSHAFIWAITVVVLWLATGPLFHFSDTWQLIINTGTTIVTFLMVFVIQNSQNRDAIGLHLKIDELLRATQGARNSLIDLSKLSDAQLAKLEDEFERICRQPERQPS